MARAYARGVEFPNEGFVQAAIQRHFRTEGHSDVPRGMADFACKHPETGEEWIIEAKGLTTAVGLDFRTGLGQIVQRMDRRDVRYAIAVPDIAQFKTQIGLVRPWVRQALGLWWLIVGEDGIVTAVGPED